jgi:hypothetical protein
MGGNDTFDSAKNDQCAKECKFFLLFLGLYFQWVEFHFSDFTKDMIEKLFAFIDYEVIHSSGAEPGKQLRKSLEEQINAKTNNLKTIPIKKEKTPALLRDMDPKEVARQMTLIEYSLYAKIQVIIIF